MVTLLTLFWHPCPLLPEHSHSCSLLRLSYDKFHTDKGSRRWLDDKHNEDKYLQCFNKLNQMQPALPHCSTILKATLSLRVTNHLIKELGCNLPIMTLSLNWLSNPFFLLHLIHSSVSSGINFVIALKFAMTFKVYWARNIFTNIEIFTHHTTIQHSITGLCTPLNRKLQK